MSTTPPIACDLRGPELTDRGDWMRELGRGLLGVDAGQGYARLRFDSSRGDELAEFVRAESACCAFFDFELETEDGASELAISAPADAAWAVRGLVAGFVAGWAGFA